MAVTSGKDALKKLLTTAGTGADAVMVDLDTLIAGASGVARLEAESARCTLARAKVARSVRELTFVPVACATR